MIRRRARTWLPVVLCCTLLTACAAGDLSSTSGTSDPTTDTAGAAGDPGLSDLEDGLTPYGPGDPDAPVSSPELPPGQGGPITSTTLVPTPEQGVVAGWATGGIDCPPEQACIAIAVVIAGSVQAQRDGRVVAETPIDPMGGWALLVEPGTYDIVTVSDTGRCESFEVTAVANAVVEVGMRCVGPPP